MLSLSTLNFVEGEVVKDRWATRHSRRARLWPTEGESVKYGAYASRSIILVAYPYRAPRLEAGVVYKSR